MPPPKRGSSKNLDASIASKVPRKATGAADGSATTRSSSRNDINEVTPTKTKDKHKQGVDKYQTFPMPNPYLKKAAPEELSDDPVDASSIEEGDPAKHAAKAGTEGNQPSTGRAGSEVANASGLAKGRKVAVQSRNGSAGRYAPKGNTKGKGKPMQYAGGLDLRFAKGFKKTLYVDVYVITAAARMGKMLIFFRGP